MSYSQKMDRHSRTLSGPDVQASLPALQVSLSRVGVTGVEKVIRIRDDHGDEQLFSAKLDCFVDLGPRQKGAHMSRFEEVVNEAIGEVILGESAFRAETLAERVATIVRERRAPRARRSRSGPLPRAQAGAGVGNRDAEIYTLFGSAVASERGTRRLVGVAAQGITACPCAQEIIAGRARERLLAEGFDADQIERILDHVPVATPNQRGSARCTSASRRTVTWRSTLRPCWRSSRARCRARSTS